MFDRRGLTDPVTQVENMRTPGKAIEDVQRLPLKLGVEPPAAPAVDAGAGVREAPSGVGRQLFLRGPAVRTRAS